MSYPRYVQNEVSKWTINDLDAIVDFTRGFTTSGTFVHPYTYTVTKSGSDYKIVNAYQTIYTDTDLPTILQSAIDAAGGDAITLLFQPGVDYTWGSAVTSAGNLTLIGYGANIKGASGQRLLTCGDNDSIYGFNFDGGDDTSANTTSYFILAEDTDNTRFVDCNFTAMANIALAGRGASNGKILNCNFTVIRQASGISGVALTDNDAGTSASSHWKIIGCYFENADKTDTGTCGVMIYGSNTSDLQVDDVLIDGCTFINFGRSGSGPRGDIDIYNDATNIRIKNCHSVNTYSFVKADDVNGLIVSDNQVNTSSSAGILVQDRYTNTLNRNITINNNTLTACTVGIKVEGELDVTTGNWAQNVEISGNNIVSSTSYGIYCRYIIQMSISKNKIITPTSAGIYVLSSAANPSQAAIHILDNTVLMGGVSNYGVLLGTGTTPGSIVKGNVVYDVGGTYDGIYIGSGTGVIVTDNTLVNIGGEEVDDNGTGTILRNNYGCVTENGGTGSITSGNTQDTVTHGCSYTPTSKDIVITVTNNPTNTPGAVYLGNITSSQFTVNCENDPGASGLTYAWAVRRV